MRALPYAAVVIIELSLVAGRAFAAGMQSQGANPPSAPANQFPQFTGSSPVMNGAPVFVPTMTTPTIPAHSGSGANHGDSHHGHDFDHDRNFARGFRDRNGFFVGGFLYPSWYSYGVAYAPDTVAHGYGSDNGYTDPGYVAPPYSATNQVPNSAATPSRPNYYQLGVQWAQDLRRNIVTWDQFIGYMKESVLTALPSDEAEFRKGFISAYGSNAEAAINKAAEQAGEVIPKGPKIIYMGPQE